MNTTVAHSHTSSSGIRWGIVGQIKPVVGEVPPPNWALCDGSELAIDEHPALFAIIGARFGGDGISTFALPDLNAEQRFAICLDGYFPLEGMPLNEWQLADETAAHVEERVRTFQQAYGQGYDPLGGHVHVADLDPDWLERQTQVLVDAYNQGHDPLHRHVHVNDLDPAWLERQVQVLLDAYGQGQDPLHRHTPHTHLDSEWLERQAQVLIDAYTRHSHPLERHTHVDELDPAWLERQVQVIFDALAQGHDPHSRHPHVSQLDPDWLATQVEVVGDANAENEKDPPDDLRRIEGIGPKIAALLNTAGIQTFTQLANMEPDQLRDLLRDARLYAAQPDTWPEQAALAAGGRWAELADLQKKLKGGRRV